MKVEAPRLFPSPRGNNLLRVETIVEYASWWARSEPLWFDLPMEMEGQISRHGDPWLTALFPLAVSLGESVEMAVPITQEKRANCEAMLSVWREWYPWLQPITILAEEAPSPTHASHRLRASFYSGGLDSSFTLARCQLEDQTPVDELIFIFGMNPADEDDKGQIQLVHQYADLANRMGVGLTYLATNLRQTRFQETHYDSFSVGSLLGAIGLLLAPRYHEILISSTWAAEDLHPSGSHPRTDPLLANDITRFRHYGDDLRRFEKIEFLLEYPSLLAHLRVCWEGNGTSNCGRCLKCLRTMTALEIMGALPMANSFGIESLDLEFLSRQVFIRERRYFIELHHFALERGRPQVAAAIETAFARTDRLQGLMIFGLIPRLRSLLLMRPSSRRLLRPIYHRLRRLGVWLNRQII